MVATSRSGGAFDFYGRLKGEKVYTIYITTALPTVMSYADPASAAHGYAEDLTAPQADAFGPACGTAQDAAGDRMRA